MKKKAFTLAEVLITLAIIGILAAVTVPLIGHIKPDKEKMLYFKAYNTLAANVRKISKDTSLYEKYMEDGNGGIYNVSRYPLYNMDAPTNSSYSGYSGKNKLGNIIKDVMNGKGDYTEFTTKNGMVWQIDDTYSEAGDKITSYTKVVVDVNGNDKGSNRYYGENGFIDKPDRFVFYITASGRIIPGDMYGQMYMLKNKDYKRQKGADEKSYIESQDKISDLTNNESKLKEYVTFNKEEIKVTFDSDQPDTSSSGTPDPDTTVR